MQPSQTEKDRYERQECSNKGRGEKPDKSRTVAFRKAFTIAEYRNDRRETSYCYGKLRDRQQCIGTIHLLTPNAAISGRPWPAILLRKQKK